jgi:hypothetical protein
MQLEEDKNPVNSEIEGYFESVRTGVRPRADLEVGLADSAAVIAFSGSFFFDPQPLAVELAAVPPARRTLLTAAAIGAAVAAVVLGIVILALRS